MRGRTLKGDGGGLSGDRQVQICPVDLVQALVTKMGLEMAGEP